MKVKELIEQLSKMDPELDVVSRVDKYSTHKPVTYVKMGCFDRQIGSFDEYVEGYDMDVDAVSVSG